MIKIESYEDLSKIHDIIYKAVAKGILDVWTYGYQEFIDEEPEFVLASTGKIELIDNAIDDITDRENLNKEDGGLLCEQYELVEYITKARVFIVLILMNNEYGVHYVIPDDMRINQRLREKLSNHLTNTFPSIADYVKFHKGYE